MSLVGKRIVVTRAAHQADDFSYLLERRGAVVVEVPTIEITDPDDGGLALREAFARVGDYEWLVATSVNTVTRIAQFLPVGVRAAAIGPATAEALRASGVEVEIMPPQYVAESLVEAFPEGDGRVLIPRAAVARDVLPEGLRAKGWTVDVVTAYKTVAAPSSEESLALVASADAITFTSSSTVQNFVDSFGLPPEPLKICCIGPITADTARRVGLRVDIEATEHTIPGLVDALAVEFSTGK